MSRKNKLLEFFEIIYPKEWSITQIKKYEVEKDLWQWSDFHYEDRIRVKYLLKKISTITIIKLMSQIQTTNEN